MKINKLKLFARSIKAQRLFYEQVLGFDCHENTPGKLVVKTGASELIFSQNADYTPYHFAFNIPENQLKEAESWISKKVDLFEYKGDRVIYFKNWDAHAIYFEDADGNVLEFIARHTLPNQSDKPFGSDSILEICEIGIPADNLPAMRSHIKQLTSLTEYSGFSDAFTALGDAHGLLILVPTGRNWLPTEKPSIPAPFTVEIEQKEDDDPTELYFSGSAFEIKN